MNTMLSLFWTITVTVTFFTAWGCVAYKFMTRDDWGEADSRI